ncbi:e3 ubiquitin-protein ligase [Gigaspora margarita]|uniref:E3 ubiquitin-protein ligase n=1 Tax=Gigaspora margarita TaxID=4874 RepID=A0A8H4EJI7_GIGMA|nr:e3 ubiquitin-protein ligase [Gigaspora margarita]
MICLICGQNKVNLENLNVPNSISENLLYHILTCLESQTPQIYTTDQQLDLIKHTNFWRMIFNKTFQSVVITESNISTVRKECDAYEERLRHLKAFYSTFCPPNKVVDSDLYTRDLETKLKILSNVSLKETSSPHYWERHEDVIQKAADIYEFANSKTFINIYETHLSQITDEVNVNYVIIKTFKNYKEKKWMQLKYSEAFPLWKGVTDIKTELELISKVTYLSKSNKDLENSLKHLTAIPKWEERLQKLSAVVAEFVRYVNDHNPIDNENYWSLIKELASASDLLDFLQTIAEHDIKNLINGVDDFSDERWIQEDTVSSLIQVKQLVVQLMNKANKIDEFLRVIQKISQENPSLPNKITVCAGFNMALQNIYVISFNTHITLSYNIII